MSTDSPIIFFNEDSDSYHESYTDAIYTGDPVLSPGDSSWLRKRAGSKVAASSSAWTESLLMSIYWEGSTKPAEVYGGSARFAKAFNPSFVYKDSKVPSITKIFTTGSFGSGSVCAPSPGEATDFFDLVGNDVCFTALFSTNGYITGSNTSQRISNTEWTYAFPFEKKYSRLSRDDVYANATFFGSINDLFFKHLDSSAIVPRDELNVVFVSGSAANSQLGVKRYIFFVQRTRSATSGEFVDIVPTNSPVSRELAAKAVFGVNTAPASTVTYAPSPTSGDTYVFASGAFVEGWKYGLSSGIASNPYAVFLPGKFGQPFHLLYTSVYSAMVPTTGSSMFFSDNGPLGVNGGVNFISGSALAGEQDMWLTASIYSGSNMSAAYAVNPKCSGIYDRYCRAGMPWFDNDPRLDQ